ncbi:MAG: 30S ribosome-binding factor RbfA [Succinatimonas sp.]|jgi:ribosome-binding factor A|uniref:30S ribosome-binding factor RbfA n=1 Tax=Succinivibrio sp. TaxID=2053619 RepID=UPI00033CACDE|nr:30S ribosome-binding factor RbfA [Succinivibrio sp.]MCI6345487.1 30S ribosome-binding factor RbfA [Succinatimonas sp.]CCX92589.1 ribosome-binding factor A [Succinatimonas sp. CAG:777]HJI59898.1 30S ribosome-binding factor RbfA [Succinivibrionaceae bacterium]MBQ8024454.1 30S ribosome-binding factor RbfA [Succinivibrio sp.]
MPRSYGRNERVAAAVRRELADVLQNELHDPRVKNATITEVDVSPDLRNARVYISFLTDKKEEIDAAMKGLKSAKGFLRSQLASRLNLRYMPDLDLRYDSLLTESMKLDALIAKGLNKN